MNRRDCIKIGAASIAGLVSLTGCVRPGGEEEDGGEEGGGGEGGEGEGGEGGEGGGEDKIETDGTREGRDAFASPE